MYTQIRHVRAVAGSKADKMVGVRSHAAAAAAAAQRKSTWPSLRNLMRRRWLKIPWGSAAASGALGQWILENKLSFFQNEEQQQTCVYNEEQAEEKHATGNLIFQPSPVETFVHCF